MRMKLLRSPSRIVFLAVAAGTGIGAMVSGTGCSNIANMLAKKQKVIVDAIAAPEVPNQSGLSYRLMARRAAISNVPVQIPVVAACVHAALSGQGMFDAPPNVPPDLFIEVGFGTDNTPRIDLTKRETYLQLSARTNPEKSLEKATGPELWDVRVAVFGVRGRMEGAMPLLSSVAAAHIGQDTHSELELEVPLNSPHVASVRESAIVNLESGNRPAGKNRAPNAAPKGSPAGAAGTLR